ncbi:hypothetical protein [Methylobacterium nigriterrae]|uniref:hypothetical protein n=1 Tax=Methylobacterium nigriterrae TaxID=3127512 RepID=UPI003013ABBF
MPAREYYLDDGRWWDAPVGTWRDGKGRPSKVLPSVEELASALVTRVVLATAHRDHDTSNLNPPDIRVGGR